MSKMMMGMTPLFIIKILTISIVGISLLYTTQFVLDAEQFSLISTPSYAILPGILVILSVFVAIHEWKNKTQNKFAMTFFAVGVTSWFVAEQVWTILDYILESHPYPSYADIFYLLAYPFFAAFFILYLRPIRNQITKNSVLFSVAVSMVFLIPTFLVNADYSGEKSTLEICVDLLYPILSSMLLFFTVLGMLFFFKGHQTYFWTMMLVGFLIETISDNLFLFTALDNSHYDGHFTDLLYLIGYLFFICGIVFYFKSRTNDSTYKSQVMTFETINKFVTPFIITTIFSVTSITLLYFYSYGQELSTESLLVFLFVGISVVIAVFSGVVYAINKNVSKFIHAKTSEIESQKLDLKESLEKKSSELQESLEFSNMGVNLSQIIHDLRNPLTVTLLNLEMLENVDIDNPIISKRLKRIKKSLNLMEEQMKDLLSYVRNPIIQISKISLFEILDKSIQNIDIPKTVTIHLPNTNVEIQCDPVRMISVFMNLLTNAIEAMNKDGEIVINVKQDKNKTIIAFENSGPDIPPDIINSIFEPLFTTKQSGTGLGLATCKKIIMQHHGSISVKNNPTTFTIELPSITK